MCRFMIFKGSEPIVLANLITRPSHSIINQAFDSRLRLDARPINADGFGVGWYDQPCADNDADAVADSKPCVFQAITPAWSNRNLHRLAEKIRSPLVFAHVRASTSGALSEENCHPWMYGSLLWMHNGNIADFAKIKRPLQAMLADEFFEFPQGSTDSEWCFALFLDRLSKLIPPTTPQIPHALLRQAMLSTISTLNSLRHDAGLPSPDEDDTVEPSLINFAVSDGRSVVATRYVTSRRHEAASLYFATGTGFEAGNGEKAGEYRMMKCDKRERIVVIASEPLTFEKADWLEIPCQTLIVITPNMNVLQFPILDEHFQHTLVPHRDPRFVQQKGLHFAMDDAPAREREKGREREATLRGATVPVA